MGGRGREGVEEAKKCAKGDCEGRVRDIWVGINEFIIESVSDRQRVEGTEGERRRMEAGREG